MRPVMVFCSLFVLFMTGCGREAGPLGPGRETLTVGDVTPGLEVNPGNRAFVLSSLLIGNAHPPNPGVPEEEMNIVGTLELRLQRSIGNPDVFEATGQAHLVNDPDSVPYTKGVIIDTDGIVVIDFGDPYEFPGGDEGPEEFPISSFSVNTTIPADLADAMAGDPCNFTAIFYNEDVAMGELRLGAPIRVRIPK